MPRRSAAFFCAGLFLLYFNVSAQDQERTVVLAGNRHPLARAEFEVGPVAPDFPMQRMILVLAPPSADQQAELDALIDAQQDPASPEYHRWLTAEDFAERFGVSQENLRRVSDWLAGAGFTIDEIPAGGRSIIFSGTAAQVETAFHTPMRTYRINGAIHHANSSDPSIPESLAAIVAGAVSLHDFPRAPMHHGLRAAPQYTSGTAHYLAPADFATIYDAAAAYTAGFTGSGQSIAIAGRTNIQLSDIQTFRSTFHLLVNNPTVIVNGTNPGILSMDEESEADLDVEWSGAVAPMAAVKFVVSASTNTTDGIDLSAQYIVSNNIAPVLSVSFGSCEAQMGSAERSFYNNLWQQAAAQGITALVAVGDSGAAGCDSPSESKATLGQAVNGLCSTPYSVCVGGTELNENGNNSLYWSAGNNASYGSALSYIPEVAWNESGSNGGSELWAGGGGASAYYSKPSWQSGPGVPADSRRDVPDISLSAATHDGYLVDILGGLYLIGGTSCASPSFAGIMALVNQKTGERQGNVNTTLYPLASAQDSGGAQVFHAISGGNNTVPGVTGFTAAAHYNQATGLGSPDVFMLMNHWTTSAPVPSFTLSVPASLTVAQGAHASLTATIAVSGGFNSAVALSVTGAPTGVTASFAPSSITGAGSSTLTLSAASTVAAGAYSLTVTGTSGSQTKTATLTLTVVQPFTVSGSASSISIARGASGSVNVTTAVAGGFSGAVALSVSKVPTGVTAAFSPASISSPGSGTSKLTLSVSASATAGAYSIQIAATSSAVTESALLSLTILAPTFTLVPSATSANIATGSSGSLTVATTAQNGFSSAIALSTSKLPNGVTAMLSPASIASPGSGTSKLTLSVASNATPGTYSITISGTGASLTQSATLSLTIPAPAATPSLTIAATPSTVTLAPGGSASTNITLTPANGFTGTVNVSYGALPSGVSARWSISGTSASLVFQAASSAAPGSYPVTITATSPSLKSPATTTLTVVVNK